MQDDQQFLQALRNCTLPRSAFDHVGHVRAGWLYVTAMPTTEAIELISEDIQAYATHLGARQKFHRTITEALMRLLASHLPAERALTWKQFIDRHPIVIEDARGLLLHFYSESRLATPQARSQFLQPDLRPLPA